MAMQKEVQILTAEKIYRLTYSNLIPDEIKQITYYAKILSKHKLSPQIVSLEVMSEISTIILSYQLATVGPCPASLCLSDAEGDYDNWIATLWDQYNPIQMLLRFIDRCAEKNLSLTDIRWNMVGYKLNRFNRNYQVLLDPSMVVDYNRELTTLIKEKIKNLVLPAAADFYCPILRLNVALTKSQRLVIHRQLLTHKDEAVRGLADKFKPRVRWQDQL